MSWVVLTRAATFAPLPPDSGALGEPGPGSRGSPRRPPVLHPAPRSRRLGLHRLHGPACAPAMYGRVTVRRRAWCGRDSGLRSGRGRRLARLDTDTDAQADRGPIRPTRTEPLVTFRPNTATVGRTRPNSLVTTVSTPRKDRGGVTLQTPKRGPGSTVIKALRGHIRPPPGDHVDPAARQVEVGTTVWIVTVRQGRNCRVDEDRGG
jgi:hypothetical protein